jgi:hypothetical protein
MKTADGPDVYGYTIFCDDIRTEVDGKLTYVGSYIGYLMAGSFPLMLPKFGFHFHYMQKKSVAVPATKIIMVLPGASEDSPSLSLDIPPEVSQEAMQNASKTSSDLGIDAVYTTVGGPVVLTNLILPHPGVLMIRAVRGDELIRLGSLQILQGPRPKPEMKEAAN